MAAPPTNPLHLYRSLLREATYLFDSHSRAILPRYIRSAFESHRVVSQPPRLNSYLKLGRRKHSLLVRANAGDVKALAKVLRFAYGRTGKRARELLEVCIGLYLWHCSIFIFLKGEKANCIFV